MIDVIGLAADGHLDASTHALLLAADKVVSSPRLLAALPPDCTAPQHAWPSPLVAGLPELFADRDHARIVVLATGDPLQAGIATTLIRQFGADAVRVHPGVGSLVLARSRLSWPAEQTDVVNLLASPIAALRRYLTPGRRILALVPGADTAQALASELSAGGWPGARLSVLADLGTDHETITHGTAATWDAVPGSPLNIVAIELPAAGPAHGSSPGLPDEAFDTDGQLTKWEVRAVALASLRPMPGQLLWDLGAGSGSVGIEWALHHPSMHTISVERNATRAARIEANALALGATNLTVHHAASADQIADLPDPDAVFIGGGATEHLIDAVVARLRPGGRLVIHTVTLDNEATLVAARARYGGDLRRILVERAEPLGRYLSWTPARAVTHWATVKPSEAS